MASDPDIRARCTHVLSGHGPESPAAALRRLADLAPADEAADFYGGGGAVARLETRTAAILGKPAALFFIKGMIAQYATLHAHAERAGHAAVAIHPLSHIDHDEANGIERIGRLRVIRLGRLQPFGIAALDAVTEPLGAVVVELPLRQAGYLLPPWETLCAIADWCRARGVALHFDGARLWESAAGYGVAPATLAALADTVYVSFYKGLGGLGGAAIAGSVEHVAALAPWKTRFGGNLFTAYPHALSALAGFDRHAARMPAYVARARALAERLGQIEGLLVNPAMPHVNAFQLLLPGTPADLAQRHARFAGEHRVWLFNGFAESALTGYSVAEIAIGAAADQWSDDAAAGWIDAFSRG